MISQRRAASPRSLLARKLDYRAAIGFFAILALWQVASSPALIGSSILPSPAEVASAWWSWLVGEGNGPYDGTWLANVVLTAQRVFIGYAIAAVLGVSLGVVMGFFRLAFTILDPIVQLFRPIPTVAWVPLSVVFFGFSPNATIFLIAYGAFFPIVLNTTSGVLRSQTSFLRVGRMLGASRLAMMRYILLPAAMPSIFTGLRLGLGISWILAIVGEMVAVRSGLGFGLLNAYTVFRFDIIVAAMISFGILGLVSDRALVAVERHVLRWRQGYDVASAST